MTIQTFIDIINAGFQFGASLSVANSIRVLWKTKQTEGLSSASVAFFFVWGLWNIFYYPNLGQWFSFAAGLMATIANCIWVISIWWIRKHKE